MKMDQFNKWCKEQKEILFEDEEVQHIQIGKYVYIFNKKDNDIYMFSDLAYYNKTTRLIL